VDEKLHFRHTRVTSSCEIRG